MLDWGDMRNFLIITLVILLITPCQTNAFIFKKKDYKQMFLQEALNSEKRHNYKSAFHSYEKALFYYKKDKTVMESYAGFCERNNYLEKAEELYQQLFMLTKDKEYLFKKNLVAIKNGKVSGKELGKLTQTKGLNTKQKHNLSKVLIFHYSYIEDWKNAKKNCDSLPKQAIDKDLITTCIVASEKTSDKKGSLGYYLRFSDLYPNDSKVINKIISLSDDFKNYSLEEKFIRKLSAQNPQDNGIKYRLAGVYEKQGDWRKASKVYEALMVSGDKSEHVKNSYAYDLSQLHPKVSPKTKIIIYPPKPLSGFKLSEKLFYESWKAKNYDKALGYLGQMLKSQPDNPKLLKHKVDILSSQENYESAITAIEDLQKVKPLSSEDEKQLAFFYSKTGNYTKAIEIIQNLLNKNPRDKSLMNIALEYSMAAKDWGKAIIYIEKLLAFEPKSEKLLKQAGDLYSIKQDFTNAIKYYEKLVINHPSTEYRMELANLYMADKKYLKAEGILYPLYMNNPDNTKIAKAYLNTLLAQQKIMDSYFVIKNRNLENTQEGYTVLGDLNMKYKHYDLARNSYHKALLFEPQNLTLKNKLADTYRLSDCINRAEEVYCEVLREDPKNIGARMGLGSVEIKRKHFNDARRIFCAILQEKPDYKPAKVGIAYSYIANGDRFSALDTLSQVEPDDETKLLKANIYYDLGMPTDAKKTIASSDSWDAKDLKYKIKRDNAITLTPTYSFLKQTLGENFRLNYHMGGIKLSKNIDKNTNVFMKYNVYAYSSEDSEGLNNITNEFRGGVHGRPTPKFEYHTDVGVKVFEFDNGSMIVTDDWIKYYLNDNFALKLGFYRDNLIQTYTSAVGRYIDGVFTGRVADTRTYLEYEAKFPKDFYSFGRAAYGVMYAQNLPTNQYLEGMLGVGKLLYNNPENPIIQKINFDLVTFNWTYQYNLLNLYNSAGVLYGGYFSPNFFSSNTANLKLEGEIKKLRLKYGCTGFAGVQISNAPVFTELAWGVGPYLSYRVNDHIDINASYQYFDWAFMKRHVFMVNAVIRGFRKNGKG